MEERFNKLNDLLVNYSRGNFDYTIDYSIQKDDIDTIIYGVLQLGEELRAVTIDRNFFNNIFNNVSDMIYVINDHGIIENANFLVEEKLGKKIKDIVDKPLSKALPISDKEFAKIKKKIEKQGKVEYLIEVPVWHNKKRKTLICSCGYTRFEKFDQSFIYVLVARDITKEKLNERAVLNSVIDTQEKERKRIAQDLHDSVGQKISALLFRLSTIKLVIGTKPEKVKELLDISMEIALSTIDELREISFNMMPMALDYGGFISALYELTDRNNLENRIEIELSSVSGFPRLSKELEITLYRVVQEFINNSIKHAKASKVLIDVDYDSKLLYLLLKDNGVGFDVKGKMRKGLGLRNIFSRLAPYNGILSIKSSKSKGTIFDIRVPLNM